MNDLNALSAARQQAYLGLLKKARKVNDRTLVTLLLNKISHLQPQTPTGQSTGDCGVISFPLMPAQMLSSQTDPPMWWVLTKLTLLIPGSVTALLLLACFRM